jgi:hypothetical protein
VNRKESETKIRRNQHKENQSKEKEDTSGQKKTQNQYKNRKTMQLHGLLLTRAVQK